jgi:hypothetical protein
MLSEAKHLGFCPWQARSIKSEILRFAQNDTMVGFLTHAMLALLLPFFRQLLFEGLH